MKIVHMLKSPDNKSGLFKGIYTGNYIILYREFKMENEAKLRVGLIVKLLVGIRVI